VAVFIATGVIEWDDAPVPHVRSTAKLVVDRSSGGS